MPPGSGRSCRCQHRHREIPRAKSRTNQTRYGRLLSSLVSRRSCACATTRDATRRSSECFELIQLECCVIVAHSLISRWPGDDAKTDRRDLWTPWTWILDEQQEALRVSSVLVEEAFTDAKRASNRFEEAFCNSVHLPGFIGKSVIKVWLSLTRDARFLESN